ncbi:MAG: acyl carrier protein [Gammaproteobacteria bacterium]|nr:acyl carrier protein [Gammaproteobacteria bacterium]
MAMNADTLLTFLADDLDVDTADIAPDTLLFSTGIVDSFALVSLMTFLESECGMRISPEDVNLDNFDSIERILAYVERAAGA